MPLGLLSQVKEPVGALDHDVARVLVAVARVVEVAWDCFVAVGRVVEVAWDRFVVVGRVVEVAWDRFVAVGRVVLL